MVGEKEINKFIEQQSEKIKKMYKAAQYAYFEAIISGKKEDYKKYEEARLGIETFFNNPDNFKLIKKYLGENPKDEILSRQLKILYNSYLGSQGDISIIQKIVKKSSELEMRFNTLRTEVAGKQLTDNEIKEILKTETNSNKLKEAWGASKQKGALVEKDMLELVRLRNELARSLGFENYYQFSLEISEQKEEEIERIFKELADKTDLPFKQVKKEIDKIISTRLGIKVEQLMPWHYQDPFFQEPPAVLNINLDDYYKNDVVKIAVDFYSSIGFDVNSILVKSDLYEKEGKYQHACCMDLDREGDTRIVQNVRNTEKWMDTTLHELGHAIYNKGYSKNKKLPFILRDVAHTFITEAIAQLFGRNSKNSNFLKRYSSKKINAKEFDRILPEINNALKFRQLLFSRWSQVMFNFERELYTNPEQDLNKLWYDLVKKYQLLNFSSDKPDWASKIHFVTSPVYYHNYLLGELLASQINNQIGRKILNQNDMNNLDYYSHKGIETYLTEKIFSQGMTHRWDKLIELATGEKLSTKYWLEQFAKL